MLQITISNLIILYLIRLLKNFHPVFPKIIYKDALGTELFILFSYNAVAYYYYNYYE